MATSPAPRKPLPPACARAAVPFANNPAPITAPPARSPPFIKDRRSTDCLKDGGSASLVMCMLQFILAMILVQYCALDALADYGIQNRCHLIVNYSWQSMHLHDMRRG